MRIAIREQLVLLVTLTVLIALTVVALPTWFFVHRFVIDVRRESLALTASTKASMISADLELMRSSCRTVASRLLLQTGLKAWYNSQIPETWAATTDDLSIALNAKSRTGLLQARIYTRDGSSGDENGIVNVTGQDIPRIRLPYDAPDGAHVYIGDNDENSYPSSLYPNITFEDLGTVNPHNNLSEWWAHTLNNVSLTDSDGLLLGPLPINDSFALISLTLPVMDNEVPAFVLGYLTIVAAASGLISNTQSREGLGDTGGVLLVGPDDLDNRFNETILENMESDMPNITYLDDVKVRFLLPPAEVSGRKALDPQEAYAMTTTEVFRVGEYPSVLKALLAPHRESNNASASLSTTNEKGQEVAVGYARMSTTLADWVVLVEQTHEEAYRPITTLTKILLGCVFGAAGAIFLLTYPCAHISVLPIRRLKEATEQTVAPPGYEDGYFDSDFRSGDGETPSSGTRNSQRSRASNRGWFGTMLTRAGILRKRRPTPRTPDDDDMRPFKIPGKVSERRHVITDELTELTKTFNDMSDELLKQYLVLDDKVAERTRELEISKKAAEAANESKTLFIANISHELKTPLNGIMGMCAICMEEDDVDKIKQSLRTLYKSGDLLLHLLDDLLSFSKNQIGKQLALEQKEFRIADIRSQILTIFDKQVRENKINFSVVFLHADDTGRSSQDMMNGHADARQAMAAAPPGAGRLKDMCLYGDQHRILQVIINLVSNSLKFTPEGGKVEVRIKCLGEIDESPGPDISRSSSASKASFLGGPKGRRRVGSISTRSASSCGPSPADSVTGTALAINPREPKKHQSVYMRPRSPSPPPPPNAKTYMFEFEVEDTGPGIPQAMQERVFEPFMQGDWGLSKKFGGTGLGLSICQQLANLMGGNITLRSSTGAGSVFNMQIPLKYVKNRTSSTSSSIKSYRVEDGGESEARPVSVGRANPEIKAAKVLDDQPRLVGLRQPYFATHLVEAPSAEAKLAATVAKVRKGCGGVPLRVLVADDNATNIEVVSRMLKLEDVSDVTVAKDGQEAYEQVKAAMADNRQFDVIFMDVQMPHLDGLQSTRLIREMGYTSPIVALTAFSEESNEKECFASGMNAFLSKPIRRPALKKVLQDITTIPEESESAVTTPAEEKGPPLGAVGRENGTGVVVNGVARGR